MKPDPLAREILATWKRHAVIVDAIAEGDETAVGEVLSEHMREAATRIAEVAGGRAGPTS